MRRALALWLVVGLGGCMGVDSGPETGASPVCKGHWGKSAGPATVPGMHGAYGENVNMIAPYSYAPPPGAQAAQEMLRQSVPLGSVQMTAAGPMPAGYPAPPGSMPPMMMPQGGLLSPPGLPGAPGMPGAPVPGMPMSGMPMPGMPGMSGMPGMDRGLMTADLRGDMAGGIVQANYPPGIVAAQPPSSNINPFAGTPRFPTERTQVRFTKPTMKVAWLTKGPDGKPAYSSPPLETPAKYNFLQGAIYQLKLSNIEGRPGVELYPTLEVVPSNFKTEEYLAHSYIPLEFTQEDFKQVADGNFVTKVIYLPDPRFQELAGVGASEIISTRLEPGVDPIKEALRHGSILLVIRMGSIDREAPNTPPLNVAPPPAPPGNLPSNMLPPGGPMVPFGARPPGMPNGPMPNGAMMPPPGAFPNGPMGPGGAPMGPFPQVGSFPPPGGVPPASAIPPPGTIPPPNIISPPPSFPPPSFPPSGGRNLSIPSEPAPPGLGAPPSVPAPPGALPVDSAPPAPLPSGTPPSGLPKLPNDVSAPPPPLPLGAEPVAPAAGALPPPPPPLPPAPQTSQGGGPPMPTTAELATQGSLPEPK